MSSEEESHHEEEDDEDDDEEDDDSEKKRRRRKKKKKRKRKRRREQRRREREGKGSKDSKDSARKRKRHKHKHKEESIPQTTTSTDASIPNYIVSAKVNYELPTAAAVMPQVTPTSSKRHRSSVKARFTPKSAPGVYPSQMSQAFNESKVYSQLLKLESCLDAVIIRRQDAVKEALMNNPKQGNFILRLILLNTYENQGNPLNHVNPPGWTLRLYGQILRAETREQLNGLKLRVSDLFSDIYIELETPDASRDVSSTIHWRKAASPAATNGFEVKRVGNTPIRAVIRLYRDFSPEQYTVADPLSSVLNLDARATYTKAQLLAMVLHYIKERDLIALSDPTQIIPNEDLAQAFGKEPFAADDIAAKLIDFLSLPKPITLIHHIRFDGHPEDNSHVVEIPIRKPNFTPEEYYLSDPFSVVNYFTAPAGPAEADEDQPPVLTDQVQKATEEADKLLVDIRRRERRYTLLRTLETAPAAAINQLVATRANAIESSQLLNAVDHAQQRGEPNIFRKNWMLDAVDHYITAKKQVPEPVSSTPSYI